MLGPLPSGDPVLAADRQRPAEVVQDGAATVRRLHQLAPSLLRRRAADRSRVAPRPPAIVNAVHAGGVVAPLAGPLDAVKRNIEQCPPLDIAHRQAAAEAGAD